MTRFWSDSRPQPAWPLWGLVVAQLASFAAAAEPAATLRWSNGDSLPGKVHSATSAQLCWETPLFVSPVWLDLKCLASIRFMRDDSNPPVHEPIRFVMKSGDILLGRLLEVTDDEVVIESRRHGQCRLLRSAVQSFRLVDNAATVFLGPTGEDGWRTLSAGRQLSEWKADVQGRLTTTVSGAELFRDVELPEKCEVDITLSYQSKPGFLITFATADGNLFQTEVLKLDTWSNDLVLQTLETNGFFKRLGTISQQGATIRLRLFWDQASGKLAVYTSRGDLLGDMTEPRRTQGNPGLYIQNKGSSLTLVRLQINRWDGGAPQSVGDVNRITLANGKGLDGRIKSFDRETAALTIVDGNGEEREVDFSKVSAVRMADEAPRTAETPNLIVAYYDETLLRGQLVSIDGGTLRLQTTYAALPVSAQLTGVRDIKFPILGQSEVPGSDLIAFEGGKLHGLLETGDDALLGWRAVGAETTSLLARDVPAHIMLAPKAGSPDTVPGHDAESLTDIVYLKNGDALPCRIEAIDRTDTHIQSAFATATRIENAKVNAVEFNARVPTRAGFRDAGWVVTGAAQKTGDQIVFTDRGTLGHQDLLKHDEFQFHLSWKPGSQFAIMVGFFTPDARRLRQPSVMLYSLDNVMRVQGIQAGAARIMMRANNLQTKTDATIRFSFKENKLELFVDERSMITLPLDAKDQNDKGVVMTVQRLNQAPRNAPRPPADLLSISDFKTSSKPLQYGMERKQFLLTVPRFRKQNPPTHVLAAQNGDLLRGRLIGLTSSRVQFACGLDELSLPRERLSGIIWLDTETSPASPGDSETARAILDDGTTLTFSPESVQNDQLVGRSAVFGECRVPLGLVRQLYLGNGMPQPELAYADWKLVPAKEPEFVDSGASDGSISGFGTYSPLLGTAAADFEADLLSGGKFRLSEYSDKVVILDFWASWCGPCVRSMPHIMNAVAEFPDDKVVLLAVNQQESVQTAREFLTARGWDLTVALDTDGQIGRQFQVEAIPQTVIIARGGIIARLSVGDHPNLEQDLKAALHELVMHDPDNQTPP